MAAPTVTVTVKHIDLTRRYKRITYAIQLSGTTPSYTGPDVVDLTAAKNPKGFPRAGLPVSPLPADADILPGPPIIGYSFTLKQKASGATLKNFELRGWNGSTEITTSWPTGTYGATAGAAPEILFTIRTANFN